MERLHKKVWKPKERKCGNDKYFSSLKVNNGFIWLHAFFWPSQQAFLMVENIRIK